MKILRHAALIACAMAAAVTVRAAERTGPEPSEVIYPRDNQAAASPETNTSATKALAPIAPSTGGMGPAVGYVVALLALVAGAFYLVKRGSLPRPFAKSDGKLRVLETRMLGNRQFLVVVEYEDAKMLVGVCPGRIDYLTPLAGHPLAASSATDDEEPAMPGKEERR